MILRRSAGAALGADPRFVLLAFVILTAILHAWRFLAGIDGAIRYHDTFDSEFPRYALQAHALLESGPTAWLAQIAGGMPTNAHHFTSLHPLVLAHLLLPPWAVFDAILCINFLAAGYGAYRLLAVNLDVRHSSALLVALIYASFAQAVLPISGFESAIPLVVSLLHGPSARPTTRIGGAVAATALTAYAYPILHGPALALFQAAYLAVQWARGRPLRREFAVAAVYWVAVVAMFAPNLVSLLEFLPYNHRRYAAETGGGVEASIVQAMRFMASQQVGTVQFLPALAGAFVAARWDRALVTAAAALLAAVAIVLLVTPPFDFAIRHTFLAKMDLYQSFRGLPALLMMVTGLALDRTALGGRRTWAYGLAATTVLAALSLAPASFRISALYIGVAPLAALALGIEAGRWIASPSRPITGFAWALTTAVLIGGTITLANLLSYRYADIYEKYAPPPELIAEHARDPFRVALLSVPSSPIQITGLETVDSRGPLFFGAFKRLLELAARAPADERRRLFWEYIYELRLDVLTGKVAVAADLRLGVLAAMNVRYLLSGTPIGGLEPIVFSSDRAKHGYRSVIVYRVPGALPRGYLAPAAVSVDTETAAVETLKGLTDAAWRDTVVFSRAQGMPPSLPAGGGACGTATPLRHVADAMIFDARLARDCALVLPINFHRRWQAAIDGRPVDIYPANLAFMAVVVPKGAHEVRFAFRSPGFPWLLFLVPLGWVALFAAAAQRPSPGARRA